MIDLFSRKVVGWSMGSSNNGQLVQDSLNMAIHQRKPTRGLIHHTDRGSTYAAAPYKAIQDKHGMIASMSRKRDCWDNAVAESFFSNLKNELTYWAIFNSRDQARSAIFEYIEIFYNRQRLHQTLDYVSPEAFEQKMMVA
jgi:transposase InsO family protein